MHNRQKPLNGVVGQPLSKAERNAIDERTETLLGLIEKYTLLTSHTVYGTRPLTGFIRQPPNPLDDIKKRVVSPLPDDRRVVSPMLRALTVSTMSRRLLPPNARPELAGFTANNHVAVPFRLGPSASPTSLPPNNPIPAPSNPKQTKPVLVGAERDYGLASRVYYASVRGPTCPTPPVEDEETATLYELARAAQEVQEQIVALLLDEYERGADGCLSLNGYNCDWSPTFFAGRFLGEYAAEREELFGFCTLLTGGNTLDNPDPLFNVPSEDRTMSRFGDKLASVQGALDAMLEGLPYVYKGGDDHRVGESVAGGKEIGDDSWFGAGYDYTTEWTLAPKFPDNATSSDTACGFAGSANAEFNAHVSVLGRSIPIVRAVGNSHTADGNGGFNTEIEFLDQTFESGASETFHQFDDGSLQTNRASATVVVVVVPVTFQAFGELEFGYTIEAAAKSNNDCDNANPSPQLELAMLLQPFAKVNAVASAAVGVSGAQAGVRGRIALLDAKLPISARLVVGPDPAVPSTIMLFPAVTAALDAATMSGRMSAFAEVGYSPFDYEAEKTIYSWRGLHDNVPLWQLDSDPVYLAAFNWDAWAEWKQANISYAAE